MRTWFASRSLRWIVLILTTWCLNGDIVQVAVSGSHSSELVLPATTMTVSALATDATYSRLPRLVPDRCGCHQGLVLPIDPVVFAWSGLPAADVLQVGVHPPRSIHLAPTPRPPLL